MLYRIKSPILYKKLRVIYPESKHACIKNILPNLEGMNIFIILNDALFDNKKINSIKELKEITGLSNLAKIKQETTLIEGQKILPKEILQIIKLSNYQIIKIERNDCGDKTFWETDSSYLYQDLLEPFDEPIGSFTIVADNEEWLIHTRDDEPWIYCLLSKELSKFLQDKEVYTIEKITEKFPYI